MRAGVGEQVAQDLGELVGVTGGLHDVEVIVFGTGAGVGVTVRVAGTSPEGFQGDGSAGVAYRGGGDGVGRQGKEVDGFAVRGGWVGVAAALTELGEEEQVVDEAAHPVGVVGDQGVCLVTALFRHVGCVEEEFGESLDGRERGAQFVPRVREEAAQLLFRGLRAVQRRAQSVKHGVEGQAQAADLGVGVRSGDVEFEGAIGDVLGGVLDAGERAKPQADGAIAEDDHPDRDGDTEAEADPQQFGGCAVHGVQGQGDDGTHVVGPGVGDRSPVGPRAVLGRDRARLPRGQVQVGGALRELWARRVAAAQGVVEQTAVLVVEVDAVVGGQRVVGPRRSSQCAVGLDVLVDPARGTEVEELVVDLVGEPAAQHGQGGQLAQQDGAGGQQARDQHEAAAQGTWQPEP